MLGKTKGCNSSNHQRCFLSILTGLNFDYLDKHLSIKLLGGTDSVKAVDTPVTLVINTG